MIESAVDEHRRDVKTETSPSSSPLGSCRSSDKTHKRVIAMPTRNGSSFTRVAIASRERRDRARYPSWPTWRCRRSYGDRGELAHPRALAALTPSFTALRLTAQRDVCRAPRPRFQQVATPERRARAMSSSVIAHGIVNRTVRRPAPARCHMPARQLRLSTSLLHRPHLLAPVRDGLRFHPGSPASRASCPAARRPARLRRTTPLPVRGTMCSVRTRCVGQALRSGATSPDKPPQITGRRCPRQASRRRCPAPGTTTSVQPLRHRDPAQGNRVKGLLPSTCGTASALSRVQRIYSAGRLHRQTSA